MFSPFICSSMWIFENVSMKWRKIYTTHFLPWLRLLTRRLRGKERDCCVLLTVPCPTIPKVCHCIVKCVLNMNRKFFSYVFPYLVYICPSPNQECRILVGKETIAKYSTSSWSFPTYLPQHLLFENACFLVTLI